jgi:DNA-binding GntR family transcriptional regulator
MTAFQTRAQAVWAELRRLILEGEISPGSRLRQAEVAERFGVSTTPVREAFRWLENEGLVNQDPHRGVVVFVPSVADLRENYDIRIALESAATRLAAERLGEAELTALGVLLERMHLEPVAPGDFDALNHEFHMTIYEAADRPRLLGMIADLRGAASVYLRLGSAFAGAEQQRDIEAEHAAIIDALKARDGEAAGEAMREHLQYTASFAITAVERMLMARTRSESRGPVTVGIGS